MADLRTAADLVAPGVQYRLTRLSQEIADGGGDCEQLGVLAGKARDLQAERQAIDREQRQRQGRNTEHRGGHVEHRVAGRAEANRSSSGAASVIAAS